MNYAKEILLRIRLDWQEWIAYKRQQWSINRETKLLNRTINKAREFNRQDGKTYYIMKASDGNFYALDKGLIKIFEKLNLIEKMRYTERLAKCYAIVTSNDYIQSQYTQIKLRMEKKEGDKRTYKDFSKDE